MKTIFPQSVKGRAFRPRTLKHKHRHPSRLAVFLLLAALFLVCSQTETSGSEVITDIGKGLTSFYDEGTVTMGLNGISGATGISQYCGAGISSFITDSEHGVEYGGFVSKNGGVTPIGRMTFSTGGSCFSSYINGQSGTYVDTGCTLSTFSYGFSVRNDAANYFYGWSQNPIPADGQSRAMPILFSANPGGVTWTITSGNLGASIDSSSGLVTAGKTPGTIRVRASKSGLCHDQLLDVAGCNSDCGSGCPEMGQVSPTVQGSVDVRINLGWHRRRDTAGFLQIHEETPSALLATPATLKYNFIRPGVEKIVVNNELRQVKSLDGLADVVTNNANKYHIDFYSLTNVLTRSGLSGAYPVTGNPMVTVTVENPGNDTNKLRVTQTREGTDTIWNYAWLTNGWSMTNGAGLQLETKTSAWSETNTLRTETYQIRSASDALVFQRIQKFRTNAMMGERLIEEVSGTGNNALTNSYSWTTNGWLEQVVRSDGSWEVYHYDSQYRPTNIYSSYRNQAVTTDGSLCRRINHDYTTNVIPASGDEGFYNSTTPRRTIEYLLGQEIGRKYFVATNGARIEYQCINPGAAWDNSSNLVTITRLFTNGYFIHEPRSVLRPDGTIDVFEYNPVKSGYTNYNITNIVMTGHPSDAYGTNIDAGTKTTSILDHTGKLLSKTVIDVPSGITLASETYSYDGFKRLTNTTYLDGTSASTTYDCCSTSSSTDRDGTVTTYTSDDLKRILTTTRNGITVSNVYDAAGNILSMVRIGTNGNAITTASATFDDAGRQMSATDAVGNTTSFTNHINSGGQTVKTTTYANGSTRIETFNRDGSLTNLTGTAVHGLRYDYGVESEGGTQRAFTKEIKLNTDGSDSSEWMKTYTDLVGNSYKTVFPDSAASQTFYNSSGQASKQVDPDGVTTLFQYDDLGELEYTAIDINANGTIDFAGADRITLTTNVVVNNGVKDVRRTVTYVWGTTNLDSATLISVNETSVDGLRTWNASFGVTNQTRIVFAGSGNRYVTNTAPDDTVTVQTFQNGRLTQLETRNSTLGTLSSTTYSFDAHGRATLITDARTGTTTNTFDDADRIISTSTPAPGDGSSAQVTSMTYNNMGWVTTNTLPDGGLVKTIFHLTGEQATNSGTRTYPVAYTYDYAGRLKTMTTWTNFASAAGAAVTEWKYDGQRGWLTNKVYADGKGPSYTYTSAARLSTRTWARGVTTTYGYNTAGELSTVDYSDSTEDVSNTFDRRGRMIQTVGTLSTASQIFDNAGNLLSESFTAGPLSGITLTNEFDHLLRRTNVAILNSQSSILNSGYAFDAASRLSSVTFGTNSAVYTYLTNSSLVDNVAFKNGATTRMTTSNRFDNLNRLALKDSRASGAAVATFGYALNTANQRTGITNADSSRWAYAYDTLGQVTSGKRYWSDGGIVAGQQFEYTFDDIGNRLTAASGGDQSGANLRSQNYSANNLNQPIHPTHRPAVCGRARFRP